VRTAAPRWLFDLTVTVPCEFHDVETDTGIVQQDSLSHDIPETMRRAARFYEDFDARVAREATFLRSLPDPIVIGDIPPLAFAAAARAGVPSYAVGNFTWDWIYDGYEEADVLAPGVVATIREAYAHADEAWRLPMHGGFEHISRVVDVPFVARHSSRSPEETRRAFGLPVDGKIVLSSFGGYGLRALPLTRVDALDAYSVVLADATIGGLGDAAARAGSGPSGGNGSASTRVFILGEAEIYDAGFRYEDLVGAADVVLTKPGYGIIAECLANETALVYTSRGAFREYDVLVREMPALLRCAFIDHDALFSGRWRAALDQALSQPGPHALPLTHGADVVAQRALDAVRS
jgi:L-arabinokinase